MGVAVVGWLGGCGGMTSGQPANALRDASTNAPRDASTNAQRDASMAADAEPGETQPVEGSMSEHDTLSEEERAIESLKEAGYRRGLNLCACYGIELPACAREESGEARRLFEPCVARCVAGVARTYPQLTDYLGCMAAHIQEIATCESKGCPTPRGCEARACDRLPEQVQRPYDHCLDSPQCDGAL